ncbi:MAG: helix-turn-helix transcriptional regulator [Tissierellia bacterium]|nr:helix-turn-helix transcriptional regulator [Tissierellia bacterium]
MLNKIIKEKREELKLTQEEVARAIGITRNYLSDIENGRYQPSFNTSIKLIKFLGIDLNLLPSMTEIQDNK